MHSDLKNLVKLISLLCYCIINIDSLQHGKDLSTIDGYMDDEYVWYQPYSPLGSKRYMYIVKKANTDLLYKMRMAGCIPEKRLIPLNIVNDNSKYVNYPWATFVNRCGGCCQDSHKHICQPTKVDSITYEVARYFISETGPIYDKMVEFQVEEHTECECKCKIMPACENTPTFNPKTCNCDMKT